MRRLVNVCGAVLLVAGAFSAGAAGRIETSTEGPVFRGDGGRTLPPFRVRVASTMRWTNTGAIFQTFAAGLGGGSVNSQGRTGATYLAPGSYKLQVNAIGSWTIRVASGIERPQSIGGGLVGFKGNGGRDLPPFTTRRGTNLVWTNTGAIFQIFPKDFGSGGDVNSQAKRGKSYMDAGRHVLTVNAIGKWTVGWKP